MSKLDNGWSLSPKVFEWLDQNLPENSTIIELGSGAGSFELSRKWIVFSVEHDSRFLNLYPTVNYCYAPIKDGWYDPYSILCGVPTNYDLLIVDGPPGHIGRNGLLKHFSQLFDPTKPILVDDINRQEDMQVFNDLHQMLGGTQEQIDDKDKSFGILNPGG